MLLGKISADFQWTRSLIQEVLPALCGDATMQELNIHQAFFSGDETVIARRKTRDSHHLIRQKEWADRRAFLLLLDQ